MRFRNTLVSTLLLVGTIALAADVTLRKGDFVSAKEVKRGSQILVQGTLSDSGAKKVNASDVKEIQIQIAGIDVSLKRRVPITGNKIEAGPFTHQNAEKIVNEINHP